MRCIHHVDADGYGAAAIVRLELTSVWDTVEPKHFVEYDYNGNLVIDDEENFFKENDTLCIVDVSLDNTIFDCIKKALKHNMRVIHIDHHVSTQNYINNLSDEDRELYNTKVISMFSNVYSGCMLTWIYACMSEEERLTPNEVPYDLSDDLAQLALYPDSDKLKIYGIPLAVRLIDDNDVWRHSLPESKLFASAWSIENKNDRLPLNLEFWRELLYEGPKKAYDMIDNGELIFKFQENQSKSVMYNAFEVKIGEYNGIAVNCPFGNSRLFGDAYDKYDFVCKYSQTEPNRWKYTFYSKDDGADCETLVKTYFNELNLCGGHLHSAGATLSKNVFDNNTNIG